MRDTTKIVVCTFIALLLFILILCTVYNPESDALQGSAPEVNTEGLCTVKIRAVATAYCPCSDCCGKCDGITSTGVKAEEGRTCAADPSVFPYGTRLMINDHIYTVEDCGGAVKGCHVDIFYADHASALEFGRKTVYLEVIP